MWTKKVNVSISKCLSLKTSSQLKRRQKEASRHRTNANNKIFTWINPYIFKHGWFQSLSISYEQIASMSSSRRKWDLTAQNDDRIFFQCHLLSKTFWSIEKAVRQLKNSLTRVYSHIFAYNVSLSPCFFGARKCARHQTIQNGGGGGGGDAKNHFWLQKNSSNRLEKDVWWYISFW